MDPNELTVQLLRDALGGVKVSTEMPADRPSTDYVGVYRNGGYEDPFLLQPRYDLVCWSDSDKHAYDLAMSCVNALWDAAQDHPYLSAAQLETLSRDEWSRTGQARYVATVSLVINTDE